MYKQYRLRNYHVILIAAVVVLTVLGIIAIGSAKASVQNKQVLGMGLGLFAMAFISLLDYSYILRFSPVYYVGINLLLLYVRFNGKTTLGAQRWIKIAGIQFQPSELAKVVIIIFFAWLFMQFEGNINKPKYLAVSLALAALPLGLILIQPDTSTTIVCIFIFAVLLYIAGLSYKIIFSVIGVCIPVAVTGIAYIVSHVDTLIEDYRVKRIMSFIDPVQYSESATQQQRSIMAIATGQILGKGIGNTSATSLKNGNYIIEPQTDFIFAVIGEEMGFKGTVILIAAFLIIVGECIIIGVRAKDLSGKLICCGMGAWITFQGFVNLCVATGLMPNTGVTLPFVSYGLTSLVSLYIGLGFVLNVGLQPGKIKGGGL